MSGEEEASWTVVTGKKVNPKKEAKVSGLVSEENGNSKSSSSNSNANDGYMKKDPGKNFKKQYQYQPQPQKNKNSGGGANYSSKPRYSRNFKGNTGDVDRNGNQEGPRSVIVLKGEGKVPLGNDGVGNRDGRGTRASKPVPSSSNSIRNDNSVMFPKTPKENPSHPSEINPSSEEVSKARPNFPSQKSSSSLELPSNQSPSCSIDANLRIPKQSMNRNAAPVSSTCGRGSTVSAEASSASTSNPDPASVTKPKKKKKPKAPPQERRRRKEEKYYEGLNQKDSHIQFVSADMIKLLRKEAPKKIQTSISADFDSNPPLPSTSSTVTVKQKEIPLKWAKGNVCPIQNLVEFPLLSPSPGPSSAMAPKPSSSSNVSSGDGPSMRLEEKEPVLSPRLQVIEAIKIQCAITAPAPAPETISDAPVVAAAAAAPKGKKSKQPLLIDVSALIVSKKKDDREKRSVLKTPSKLVNRKENHKLTAGNALDSSGPGVIHRGKIRVKKKKPTKLKLTILRSRELAKILKEKAKQEEVDEVEVKVEEENEEKTVIENGNKEEEVAPVIKTELDVKENIVDEEGPKFIKVLPEITSEISDDVKAAVKKSMHNRKFRDYCDMFTSKESYHLVSNLLYELHRFQDRLYHSDPIKFKTKRRYVLGLKEAMSYLNLNKVQLLIIAPDMEKNPEPGGLDEKLGHILTSAKDRNVPYVFTGTKYNLGKPIKLKQPVSVIAVLDKQNCEVVFRALLEEVSSLQEKYETEFMARVKAIMNGSNNNEFDSSSQISEVKVEETNDSLN